MGWESEICMTNNLRWWRYCWLQTALWKSLFHALTTPAALPACGALFLSSPSPGTHSTVISPCYLDQACQTCSPWAACLVSLASVHLWVWHAWLRWACRFRSHTTSSGKPSSMPSPIPKTGLGNFCLLFLSFSVSISVSHIKPLAFEEQRWYFIFIHSLQSSEMTDM